MPDTQHSDTLQHAIDLVATAAALGTGLEAFPGSIVHLAMIGIHSTVATTITWRRDPVWIGTCATYDDALIRIADYCLPIHGHTNITAASFPWHILQTTVNGSDAFVTYQHIPGTQ